MNSRLRRHHFVVTVPSCLYVLTWNKRVNNQVFKLTPPNQNYAYRFPSMPSANVVICADSWPKNISGQLWILDALSQIRKLSMLARGFECYVKFQKMKYISIALSWSVFIIYFDISNLIWMVYPCSVYFSGMSTMQT